MTTPSDEGQRDRRMTVLKVRPREGHAEVLFAESARIYRVLRTNPHYEQAVRELSSASGGRVRVHFATPNSEIIEEAAKE